MDNGDLNLAWARALVSELAAGGARHACVSPGARSAPLAVAADECPGLRTTVHVDERSAAYFALGAAKATGSPAVLVCTSGTAAANYLPAMVEAFYDGVPLIVLTADRPHEHRDTGAWQAIDQVKFFGGYVRWFADVAVPGTVSGIEPANVPGAEQAAEPRTVPEADGLRYVRSLGSRAVAEATTRPSGPVHLNLPFREPLLPAVSDASRVAGEKLAARDQHTRVVRGHCSVPGDELDLLADEIAGEPHGLILAGRLRPPLADDGAAHAYASSVARLAAATGYPILAEPAGGLRFGAHDRSHVIADYDPLLRSERWVKHHQPRLVVRIGASFAWRHVAEFLDQSARLHQVMVDPQGAWDDPLRGGGTRLRVEPRVFCDELAERLAGRLGEPRAGREAQAGAWMADWCEASETANRERSAAIASAGKFTVGWVYDALPSLLPDGGLVQVANSMAVRDLDTFSSLSAVPLRVLANRGAAGIDGTLSSGLGAAHAAGRPVVVLTGDLAFAHDLGGLAAARLPNLDVTIVVLNDGGGGIFEHTPMAGLQADAFDRLFLVPSGVDVAGACAAFGVGHTFVSDRDGLASLVGGGSTAAGVHVSDADDDGASYSESARGRVRVAEVVVDRAANTALHRDYWAAVAEALDG